MRNLKLNITDHFSIMLHTLMFASFAVTALVQHLPFHYPFTVLLNYLFIYFTGRVIIRLIKFETDNVIQHTLWSYVSGIIFTVSLYSIAFFAGIHIIISFIQSALLVIALLSEIRAKNLKKDSDGNGLLVLVFVCILFVLCFFTVSLRSTLPSVNNGTYYYNDQLFWIGNTISFGKFFPVNEFRMVDNPFYYHHFSSILMADMAFNSYADTVLFSLFYSYQLPCMLMVLSAYELFRKITANRLFITAGMVFVLLAEGAVGVSAWHLYYLPFGFDYGYVFGMVMMLYLLHMIKKDTYSVKEIIISAVLIAFCTGFKGPIAIVVLMAYGCTSFWLLFNRRWKGGFVSGFVWLFAFLFMYIFVVNPTFEPVKPENGLQFLGLIGGFDRNKFAIAKYSDFVEILGIETSKVLKLVALAVSVMEVNRASFVLFVLGVSYMIIGLIKNRKLDIYYLICSMVCIWGYILMLFTYQNGNSQLYFTLATIPFGVSLGMRAIENTRNKSIMTVLFVMTVLLSCFDVYRFGINAVGKGKEGIDVYNGVFESETLEYLLTDDDLKMCDWLEKNVDDKEYIAVDTFEYEGLKKEEVLGVFSKKFIWNDGEYTPNKPELSRRRELVDRIAENEAVIDELVKENVYYYVQTLKHNDMKPYQSMHLVYENNSYRVYCFK